MPVYSTNGARTISSTRIAAAEGYTDHDFGRIISETYENDMRVFNLGLARDFKEAAAINENTMVSSELKALREFSIKEAWKGLVEKLKKLWAKIKGVFRNVYAKLSVWLNRSNKLYIAQNRKALEKKDCRECPIPKYMAPKGDKSSRAVDNRIGRAIASAKQHAEKITSDKMYRAETEFKSKDSGKSADDLYNQYLEECFDKPNSKAKFKDLGISTSSLLDDLGSNSDHLKNLKKASKEFDKAFKTAVNNLQKESNNAETDEEKKKYETAVKNTSDFQKYSNACSAAVIKLIKKAISNDRGLIATLVAYDPKAPKNEAMLMSEVAFSIGAMAFREETEDMTDEDLEDAAQGGDGEVSINIEIDGTADADVNVEDNTNDDD